MKINVKQIWETEIPMTAKIGEVFAMKRKAELSTGDKHVVLFRQGKAFMQRIAR